jgi:hypothetical protein
LTRQIPNQSSYNGLTITYGNGRRTGMSDSSSAAAWSFDTNGAVLTERRTISGITKTIFYSYNLYLAEDGRTPGDSGGSRP